MNDERDSAEKRLKELEMALEEEKSLSQARNKLLEANIKELNEVYDALRERLVELGAGMRGSKASKENSSGQINSPLSGSWQVP